MLILQCVRGLKSQSIDLKIPFIRQIFQVGIQSSLNLPGITRVMEDNVVLFSY